MNKNEIRELKIEQYLLNQMDENSRTEFEEEIKFDEDLKNDLDLNKQIILSVKEEELKKFLTNLNSKRGNIKSIISGSVISLLIASSIFGLVYIQYFEDLSNSFYTTYPNMYELPSRGESLEPTLIDNLFFDALKNFEQGNKWKAAKQLEVVLNNLDGFKAGDEDVVEWYLALAYLKLGRTKKAKNELSKIANDNKSIFYNEAINLLNSIR